MKKILNKIKLKHFARLMLVVIALCCITTVSAFAYNTYSIEIGFYNTNEYPYSSNSMTVIFSDSDSDTTSENVDIDDYITIDFNQLYSTQTYIEVVDGDLVAYDDGESQVLLSDTGISDGYYNIISINYLNTFTGDSIYSPQIQDIDVTYSVINELFLINLYNLSDIPTTVLVDVVDITDSYDSENPYMSVNNIILLPAPPPPPPQDTITNVWTGVLTFLTTSISTVTNVFWDGSSFTLLGMLGLIGVTIAIIILVFLHVKDFLKLR